MEPLLKDITTEGYWPLQGQVYCRLFDRYIDFSVEDTATIEYVERCATYLNALSDELIDRLCRACIRYCNSFLEQIGEPEKKFGEPRDVLKLIAPASLIVPNIEDLDEPVVHMELNCEWEIEHGMEWIIRDNRVLYVGAFNGEDPWGEYLDKEFWNYA
ncbi:MAG: hypothetical protein HYS18_11530 [Burkholderiales bacterium]|nr:hypothetical protein [Burkholderiales bacterium]